MSGNWFPKVDHLFYGGYGYASSLFYPDLFQYIPVLLRVFGVGSQKSYQIFMIIIVVATYITAYYSGKNILKDKKMGIIVAIVYSLATYHVKNLHIRAAIGEALAQIFVPLIIYGIYNLLYEEFSKPRVLVIGFFCVVYCHTITFVMCFILLLILLLFHIKELIKKPKIILKLFSAGFIVICLTSYWWGPVIEQVIFDKFQVSNPWTTLSQNGLDLFGVLVGEYGVGNLLFIIMIIGIIYYYKKSKENHVNISKLLAIVTVGLFLTTKYFDWRILEPILNSIQFPWRINTINTFFCALVVAVLYGTKRKNNLWI